MVNYYQVLGVENFAPYEEIKAAYRKRSKQLHPDLHNGSAYYTERFKELQAAYDCLGKPAKREQYDMQLRCYLDGLTNYNSTTANNYTYHRYNFAASPQRPAHTSKEEYDGFSGRMLFRIAYILFIVVRIATCDTFHSSDSYVPNNSPYEFEMHTQYYYDSVRADKQFRDSFLHWQVQDSNGK